jgi:flagellar biosynthesis component FlhA
MLTQLSSNVEKMVSLGHFPVLIVPGKIRRSLRNLLAGYIPQLVVLAMEEVPREVELKIEGAVRGG